MTLLQFGTPMRDIHWEDDVNGYVRQVIDHEYSIEETMQMAT